MRYHVPIDPTPLFAPFETVLLVVGPPDGDAATLVETARKAGVFIVHTDLGATEDHAWLGANTPGVPGGAGIHLTATPNEIRVQSDRDGVFLVSNIDLILRSNGIRAILLAGDTPAALLDSVVQFAKHRGYFCAEASALDLTRVQAAWDTSRHARRNWQSDWKSGELLVTLADRIHPRHAALVLIDVQNDFCDRRGAVGRLNDSITMIEGAVARTKELLAGARAASLFVVHVRAEYGALFRNSGSPYRFPADGRREPAVWTASAADLSRGAMFPPDAVEVCLTGSWGGEFVEGIAPQQGEAVVTKHRFSAFVDTGLDLMLRSRGIRTVVLAGVITNCCVESTARDAVMRDFYLVVAEDCVAVKDKLADLHAASLESMGLYFGLVRPSTELMTIWKSAAADKPPSLGSDAE
jgi:nicotinamidase-related amidase